MNRSSLTFFIYHLSLITYHLSTWKQLFIFCPSLWVANVLKLGKWGDLYMWEYSFSDDGKLIVADSGGAFLSSWKERYSNRTFIRSEDKKDLQKIYEQTSEEDNPIIGIFTLKNK